MASELQPCEICGKTDAPDVDEKYDDVYNPCRVGSRAMELGYAQERLCGRCAAAQFIGSYWNGSPDRHHTPIEQYYTHEARLICVKRDDLWNNARYGGGNAKLRGAEVHIRRLMEQGINHIAFLDSRTSRAGWGIAELARDLGIKATVFYGRYKGESTILSYKDTTFHIIAPSEADELRPFQRKAYEAGAQVISMPASRIYPMFYKARKYCAERHIYLLPMGLQLAEASLSVAGEVGTLPPELRTGTIVCCIATGTMFSGLLLGFRDKARIIGVYIGMTSGELKRRTKSSPEDIVRARIAGLLPQGFVPPPYEIVLGDREYYEEDNYPCPFPCDKWYDRKAWRWLNEHIDGLQDPILMWNIG